MNNEITITFPAMFNEDNDLIIPDELKCLVEDQDVELQFFNKVDKRG